MSIRGHRTFDYVYRICVYLYIRYTIVVRENVWASRRHFESPKVVGRYYIIYTSNRSNSPPNFQRGPNNASWRAGHSYRRENNNVPPRASSSSSSYRTSPRSPLYRMCTRPVPVHHRLSRSYHSENRNSDGCFLRVTPWPPRVITVSSWIRYTFSETMNTLCKAIGHRRGSESSRVDSPASRTTNVLLLRDRDTPLSVYDVVKTRHGKKISIFYRSWTSARRTRGRHVLPTRILKFFLPKNPILTPIL